MHVNVILISDLDIMQTKQQTGRDVLTAVQFSTVL